MNFNIQNQLYNLNASGVFGTILSVVAALLILLFMITVHEFGHYAAAKLLDFRVNEFSIGMGPALYKRKLKNGEQFSIRALPLGGYCAFEGEDEDNSDPRAFNNKKPWQRLIVLVAGATMNFISAILIFCIAFCGYGQMCVQAFEVKNSGAPYTLCDGDVILELNEKNIYLSTDLAAALNGKNKGDIVTAVVMRGGERQKIQIRLNQTPSSSNLQDYGGVFESLSLATIYGAAEVVVDNNDKNRVLVGDWLLRYAYEKPPVTAGELSGAGGDVGNVGESGVIADNGGTGEVFDYYIYGENGEKTQYFMSDYYYYSLPRAYGEREICEAVRGLKTGDKLYFFLSRAVDDSAERVLVTLNANAPVDYSQFTNEQCLKFLNISKLAGQWRMTSENVRFGFFENIGRAVVYSVKNCTVSLRALGQIITGKLSINNMSGTIGTIALTSQVASQGFKYVLEMAGLIGVSLAVFNLLPIPALDGARAVFVIIEWIRKKPVNRKVEGIIHAVGLIVLLIFSLSIDAIKLFI